MRTFTVEYAQRLSVQVQVDAETTEEAAEIVNRRSYPLPPRDEWTSHKDGWIRVYDGDDDEDPYEIEF